MTEITFYTREQVRKKLKGQDQSITPGADNGAHALREIAYIYRHGQGTAAWMLALVQQTIKDAGELNASQQAQVNSRTKQFLKTISHLEDEAARRIIAHLQEK